jgi:glycosyltransferase involved in cell wall biosynthesis
VPGGTGIAAVEVAKELNLLDDVDVIGVAGRHRYGPTKGFEPHIRMASLPIGGPLLFESWLRLKWPLVESVVDNADLVHSTTIIAPATRLPLVVTIHDLAFLRHPEFFTDRGNRVFRRSLDIVRDKAAMVLCSSRATLDDCVTAGFELDRLRHVPLGVTTHAVTASDYARVRATYNLPDTFVLFVGTLEPRKNLTRLIQALESIPDAPPLVIVGMAGWGDAVATTTHDVRFTGFVPAEDLPALYASARVFAFPSVLEGYGLPVIEAMAHGAPVVTSRGTSTEEVAGGAAVLVDPLDVSSIASGISEALDSYTQMSAAGLLRAAQTTWAHTARATADAYAEVLRGSQ